MTLILAWILLTHVDASWAWYFNITVFWIWRALIFGTFRIALNYPILTFRVGRPRE